MRALACVSSVALAVALQGCMTVRRGPSTMLPIETTPSGASVLLDGIDRGVTPAQLPMQSNSEHMLLLRKDCFADAVIPLKRDFGAMPWFWGNMLLPGVGHIIDLASGSAWRVYPQSVDVALTPAPCKT